jgi:hypothetical protein
MKFHEISCAAKRTALLGLAVLAFSGPLASAQNTAAGDGAAQSGETKLPRLGETGRFIMGAYHRTPKDMDPENTIFGSAILQDSWPIARVTNEQGKLYFIVTTHDRAGTTRFFVLTPGANGLLMPDPRAPMAPDNPMAPKPSVYTSYDAEKDLLYYRTPEGTPAKQATEIAVGEKLVTWKQSDGMIDLKARAVTPAIFAYLPYVREKMSGVTAWVTQEYPAEGMVFGEKVKGYFHLDQSFGRASYAEEPISSLATRHFMLWINEFTDGSTESGVFICGPDNYRGAVVVDNLGREVVRTEDINLKVQYGENNLLKRTDFVIDGQGWEFTPAPGGQSPFVQPPTKTMFSERASMLAVYDGTTIRKGEKRKLLRSWSAVETSPGFVCEAK